MNFKENYVMLSVYNSLNGFKKKINGKNNSVVTNKSILKKSIINVEGDNCAVNIGNGSRIINTTIFVRGNNHTLNVGDRCVIKNSTLWIEDEKCVIEIGNKTTIEGAHIAATEPNSNIILGEDCMLSGNIDIRNGDSHSIIDVETKKRINYAKDILIGNHVWVGNNVQILKGVKIGDDSVLGIRSVVTKDVPSNSIVTGTPAKVVRNGITWDRDRLYD